MDINVLLLVLIPLATAFLLPLVDLINLKIRRVLVMVAAITEFFLSLFIIFNNYSLIKNGVFFLEYHLGSWAPPFGINLAMDSLSMYFSTFISLAFILLIIYSIGFIGHHEGKYYVLLLLVLGAMQGAILTGDIFNLYVFIELLTVTSAPLVAFKRNKEGTVASIKYMFYGIISGLFFFIGVILLYFNVGSLNMAEIASSFPGLASGMRLTIIVIFLLSLLVKLGIFPFHYWLPTAHSACPSSISALLSGVLLKVYLYIFIRLFFIVLDFNLFQSTGLDSIILYLALFSSMVGHVFALQADDIKRMLAFSTIGHVGMILAVLLINTSAGFYGGLLHVMSHLLMKSGLFLGSGYLLQYAPSHNIRDLTGLGYKNQFIFATFIIFALGMIGIPPLIGFASKWYILLAFLKVGNHAGAILVILGSLTAIIYYMRYIYYGFQLKKKDGGEEVEENPLLSTFYRERAVTTIVYIVTILVVVTGIMYSFFNFEILAAIEELLHPQNYIKLVLGG